jgi:GH24 family phage-related lysozyme (muramidase)
MSEAADAPLGGALSSGGDAGWSIPDLLALVRHMKLGPQPADDPIAQYLAARAQDARLPPSGGLFGSGYAAYMADNAPPMPTPDALNVLSAGDPALWLARFTASGQNVADNGAGAATGDLPSATEPAPMQAGGAPTGSGVQATPVTSDGTRPQINPPVAGPPDLLPQAEPVSTRAPAAATSPPAVAPWPGADPRELARLKALLIHEEGSHSKVYKDSQQHLTVGIGHKVVDSDHLSPGQEIGAPQIDQFFQQDGAAALQAAHAQAAEAGIADPNFIQHLASVNFQLGPGWRAKFPKAWGMIKTGDYAGAADEIAKASKPGQPSDWYKQTPKRVVAFQQALRGLPPER